MAPSDVTQEPETEPRIIVQKYGGSSVADPDRLKQVAGRVAAAVESGFRVVVVVSAMGKTTDELLALARRISPAPPRRELDMLLSTGERISMALLAMALHERGIAAISFTGSQSGILTNDRHSGARIIEVRPVRIEDELARGKVVIVAGFQGMSYKREITTLGRGGSDTTAVALSAALSAESCEIYSDVDGVYSADPRVVPGARHLPEIGYDEMQELAEHGAKVLNAQAVKWAQKAGIVIHARKTSGSDKETLVGRGAVKAGPGTRPLATAVTGTGKVMVLRLPQNTHSAPAQYHDHQEDNDPGLGTGDDHEEDIGPGLLALKLLGEEGAQVRHVRLVQKGGDHQAAALLVTLTCEDLPDWGRTLRELRKVAPGLQVDDSQGMVTAVGPGLGADPRAISLSARALSQGGLHLLSLDASPLRVCAFLPESEVDPATRILHRVLIEN